MVEYHGTMRWFGRPWDAPAWEDMPEEDRINVYGMDCGMCGEKIEQGDSGVTMPFVERAPISAISAPQEWISENRPIHVECHLRSSLGSVEHLDSKCTCHEDGVYSSLSYREQAKLVFDRWFNRELS